MRKSLKLLGTMALAFSLNTAVVSAFDETAFKSNLESSYSSDQTIEMLEIMCEPNNYIGKDISTITSTDECLKYNNFRIIDADGNGTMTFQTIFDETTLNPVVDSSNIITSVTFDIVSTPTSGVIQDMFSYKKVNNVYNIETNNYDSTQMQVLTIFLKTNNASQEVIDLVNGVGFWSSSDFICDMEEVGFCQTNPSDFQIELSTKFQDNIVTYLSGSKDTVMPEGSTDAAIENPETGLSLNSLLLIIIGSISCAMLLKVKKINKISK